MKILVRSCAVLSNLKAESDLSLHQCLMYINYFTKKIEYNSTKVFSGKTGKHLSTGTSIYTQIFGFNEVFIKKKILKSIEMEIMNRLCLGVKLKNKHQQVIF